MLKITGGCGVRGAGFAVRGAGFALRGAGFALRVKEYGFNSSSFSVCHRYTRVRSVLPNHYAHPSILATRNTQPATHNPHAEKEING